MIGLAKRDAPYDEPGQPNFHCDVLDPFPSLFRSPYFCNLITGSLGNPMLNASIVRRHNMPSPSEGVAYILFLSSLAQMIRVHTPRIIAGMQNKKRAVYLSVSGKVRHSMSKLFVLKPQVTDTNHPVSFVVNLTKPNPASAGSLLVHFIPKSFTEHMGKLCEPHAPVNGVV